MKTERNLDPEKSYQRLTTTWEWICWILGAITFWLGIGFFIILIGIMLQAWSSNILVRDSETLEKKTVTRPEWNQYCQEHGISFFQQYRNTQRFLINPTPSNTSTAQTSDGADELKKYKQLLDDGTITQDEFDAKKKQILGL